MLGKRIILALAAVVLCAAAASATPVHGTPVLSGDWTGQRTLTEGGGLASAGTGSQPFEEGTGISWNITFDDVSNLYTYSYSFFGPDEDYLEMSHFILELSAGCIVDGQSDCISGFDGEVLFDEMWKKGPSNPGMPAAIYGVKFNTEDSTFTFYSDRIPVWGNFYAKKSGDGLWNLGLDPDYSESEDTLYFVPRPDTDSSYVIPEPGTFVLLGAGLVGLGLLRRRR